MLILGWLTVAAIAALGLVFFTDSLKEQEWRAAALAAGITTPMVLLFGCALVLRPEAWVILTLLGVVWIPVVALIAPFGQRDAAAVVGDRQRVDERDALFHRFYRLEPGTPEFEAYYEEHPEKRAFDDEVRALPDLCHPEHPSYRPMESPLAVALLAASGRQGIGLDDGLEPLVDPPEKAAPDEFARRISGLADYLGAAQVGFTALDPAYVYSHAARGEGPWGEEIELDHTHAVVFAVEMKHENVRQAPRPPTLIETAGRYLESGKIAVAVAHYIQLLGYRARAHVDGNYRVMCAPVAADAGLGELGRLGLLITPRFGPRARFTVVTTDMPLPQDAPIVFGVQHFCHICKKCSENCPSRSIDEGDRGVHNGSQRWVSEQDSCYHYWRKVGTDCCICVKVCPYAHPASLSHDLVRWVITRNPLARHVALWADDLAYGRRPKRRYPPPDWLS